MWKLGLAITLAFCIGCTFTTLRGTTAQDTDADRIAALESQMATQVAINRAQSDQIAARTVAVDQLLPVPKPAYDFGSPIRSSQAFDSDAVRLFCRASVAFDIYLDITCEQVATP